MGWWARLGLNQRPLRCQRSALPLSYAPLAFDYHPNRLEASPLSSEEPVDLVDQGTQMKRPGKHLGHDLQGRPAFAPKRGKSVYEHDFLRKQKLRAIASPSIPGKTLSVTNRSNLPSTINVSASNPLLNERTTWSPRVDERKKARIDASSSARGIVATLALSRLGQR